MQSSNGRGLLSAREAAGRLGIKTDTLYAYVSRGLLRSVAVPDSRERRYRPEDVERLRAGRGSGRGTRSEPLTPVIDSSICLIESGRFYYRGQDAARLAETATLEDIAGLLWGGEAAAPAALTQTFLRKRGREDRRISGGRVVISQQLGLIERCQVRLAELAAADLAALDLTRPGIIRTGWAILADMVACVGESGPGLGSGAAHSRLAAAWRLGETGADLLRRCLVLLADHELNASTFVARCVASTAATPYAVVSGALSALSGRRHGGASARAEALLHEVRREGEPMRVMAARLARDERLPGLGHPLYPEGDPRARALLAAAAAALPAQRSWIEDVAAAAYRLTGQPPNIDFVLATTTTALGLAPGAALGLFIVGRTVGWIAHAIEQYETDVLIRPRARYTGPRPAINDIG
jgi:citrate synthase